MKRFAIPNPPGLWLPDILSDPGGARYLLAHHLAVVSQDYPSTCSLDCTTNQMSGLKGDYSTILKYTYIISNLILTKSKRMLNY
jgi:hypothetical protein